MARDCTAQFTVTVPLAQYGDVVAVSGNCPQLGGWEPSAALPLRCGSHGVWRGATKLPLHARVEYKYLVLKGGSEVWENGANRELVVAADLEVGDTWNEVRACVHVCCGGWGGVGWGLRVGARRRAMGSTHKQDMCGHTQPLSKGYPNHKRHSLTRSLAHSLTTSPNMDRGRSPYRAQQG
jgi:hypothetical protein